VVADVFGEVLVKDRADQVAHVEADGGRDAL
jgi:hypothetical protein